jgi:hypothetical protein
MKIAALAQRDKAMTIPPPALTNSLFYRLGYDLPMAGAALKPAQGFFRNNMIWLLLLLLTVSTVSTVYFANRNSLLNNEIARIGTGLNGKSIPVTSSFAGAKNDGSLTDLNQMPESASGSENNNNNNNLFSDSGKYGNNSTSVKNNANGKNLNHRNRTLGSYSNGDKISSNENANQIAMNNDELMNNNSIINKSNLSKKTDHNQIRNLNRQGTFNNFGSGFAPNNGFVTDVSNYQLYMIDKSKWNFQIKKLNSFMSSPDIAIGNNTNIYDNMAFSFSYQINPFHSFGIEAGKEKFSQEFSTKNNLVYQQRPDLLWVGASYRYSAKELIVPYSIYPYIQQFAGATTIGPVFKTQAGIVFNLFGPISLVGGAEWGILFYNVDSQIYNTKKFNVFGGVSINL